MRLGRLLSIRLHGNAVHLFGLRVEGLFFGVLLVLLDVESGVRFHHLYGFGLDWGWLDHNYWLWWRQEVAASDFEVLVRDLAQRRL